MSKHLVLSLCVVLWTVVLGCKSSSSGGGTDAGGIVVNTDAGPGARDTGTTAAPLGTCAAPEMITGTMGTVMVDFDTTGGREGPLELGNCADPTAEAFPPQHVIAYRVPGTGTQAIEFTLVNDETSPDFDTVVQVRKASCTAIPVETLFAACFDDAEEGEIRSAGTTSANGGDTIYFVVTGYTEGDEGEGRLEITARANAAPVLVSASARNYRTRTEVEFSATDADGDIDGLFVEFLDAADMPVDLDPDPEGEVTFVVGDFEDDPAGQTTFMSRTSLGDEMMQLSMEGVTKLRVRVIDAGQAQSNELVINLPVVTEVGLGATCDAANVCHRELECSGAGATTCTATTARTTACAGATMLTLPFTAGRSATSTVMNTMPMGAGAFYGSCGGRPSGEKLFTFTTPATATVDVIFSTDAEGSAADLDTIVYARASCENPLSEPAMGCHDDIRATRKMPNLRSTVELRGLAPSTTHTLFVDQYGEPTAAPTPFGLRITTRPVLASGAACDPAGVENRCATGRCGGGTVMADGGAPTIDAGAPAIDAGAPAIDAGVPSDGGAPAVCP